MISTRESGKKSEDFVATFLRGVSIALICGCHCRYSTANSSVKTLEMHVTQSLTALTVRTHRGLLSSFESFVPNPFHQLRFETLEGVVEFLRFSADSVSASTVKKQ